MINANAKVSCVMVTADRIKLCARSVWCYQQQTYSNKELVVLDNGNESMAALLKQLPADEVRYKKINRTPDLVLGDLRNTALNMATGSLIIPQWDDDDWYHPQRIQRQVEILEQGHDACALAGTLMHVNQHPFTDRPYIGLLRNGVPPTISGLNAVVGSSSGSPKWLFQMIEPRRTIISWPGSRAFQGSAESGTLAKMSPVRFGSPGALSEMCTAAELSSVVAWGGTRRVQCS